MDIITALKTSIHTAITCMTHAKSLDDISAMLSDVEEYFDELLAETPDSAHIYSERVSVLYTLTQAVPLFPSPYDDEDAVMAHLEGMVSFDATRWISLETGYPIQTRVDDASDIMLTAHPVEGLCLVDISGEGSWRPARADAIADLCSAQARDDLGDGARVLDADWEDIFSVVELEEVSDGHIVLVDVE